MAYNFREINGKCQTNKIVLSNESLDHMEMWFTSIVGSLVKVIFLTSSLKLSNGLLKDPIILKHTACLVFNPLRGMLGVQSFYSLALRFPLLITSDGLSRRLS
jgi:hypothetical protein